LGAISRSSPTRQAVIDLFTGIVEEIGAVRETTVSRGRSGSIVISASAVLDGTAVGESICVSGACQTVVGMGPGTFVVDVMPETASRTTLGDLRPGDPVNLERALRLQDRIGGHLVNGHVDGVGAVSGRRTELNAVLIEVAIGGALTRYVVPRGSVAVDGVSLTVVESSEGVFLVSVIPHTLDQTTLRDVRAGSRVNVEVDILAKYVESLMSGGAVAGGERGAVGERDELGRAGIEGALSRAGFQVSGDAE
jgi:riboflavin synthase